ncbi:18502_t:CDS:2 [Racocetra persica]|uniref:18502_t:CDS:1 n=1 Tax=Racocetra persica TaxID=160502 RepID=A0ACA9LR83_9GLOM|nr:18502_t:CDS:2 [Racocetra persica]
MWIECYRRKLVRETNTNNYIEAYHKKIKYIYLITRLNRRIDFLINELVTKILPDYRQQTIQYESTYFVKSTQDENDYTIEQTGDNALTLTCNCEAYLGNPVPCKHIFVVMHKYSIKIPEQTTYLPLLNDDEQFTINNLIIRIQENNFKKRIEEMNHRIN